MAVAGLRWPPKQATRKCRLFCLDERQDGLPWPARRRGLPAGTAAGRIRPPPLVAGFAAPAFPPRPPCFVLAGPVSLTTRRRCPGVILAAAPEFQPLSSCVETS